MLSANPFVGVIALDFSKVFGTVQHATLSYKIVQLQMPYEVFRLQLDQSLPLWTFTLLHKIFRSISVC